MSTIRDVAARADVSIKTVSRVINRESGVSAATRLRVQQAIRDLDYVPNLSAQRLKRGRSELLALVLPRVESPYASKLFAALVAEARRRGYAVLVLEHERAFSDDSFIRRVVKMHRVDGVILAPPGADNPELVAFLQENETPYVAVTPNDKDAHPVSVEVSDYAGAHEATRYLISLGHRRIAHITCLLTERFSRERQAGYLEALHEAHLPVDPELVVPGDHSIESGRDAAMTLLCLPQPPTAIFAGNDEMAVGVYLTALRLGRQLPRDLSVIGFDDVPISQQVFPALTTVDQPITEIGRASVEELLNILEGRTSGDRHVQIRTRLILRDSCAMLR